eukprot:TRINITY_DN10450_c1_g2_i1.p2 TRINITY_DN10450_c1_g2~~TRINITY_DN10450_c1_g2_i1.p2  ORF type:complete len:116 (-),score=3.01 TRINITY_DN10450_c1_g2_i1:216-563(-)
MMGIYIIRNFQGNIIIYVICLFILCGVDWFVILLRVRYPTRGKLEVNITALVLEICIILVSAIIARLVGNTTDDWDALTLVFLSITTTVVNFLHHVFIMYEYCSNQNTSNVNTQM